MTDHPTTPIRETVERVTAYLSGGGLFNPELASHGAVRDLLIDCRAHLTALQAENAQLREDAARAEGEAYKARFRWMVHHYARFVGLSRSTHRGEERAPDGCWFTGAQFEVSNMDPDDFTHPNRYIRRVDLGSLANSVADAYGLAVDALMAEDAARTPTDGAG